MVKGWAVRGTYRPMLQHTEPALHLPQDENRPIGS